MAGRRRACGQDVRQRLRRAIGTFRLHIEDSGIAGTQRAAAERLELEITESWIISDLRGAARKLQQLRDLGVGIAIDDFGTGHSTFSYLQELPLDTLKIDRSFILRLDGSAGNLSTVRTIMSLAKQLGLRTVAEGLETETQLQQLREIDCELVQGFLLARPLPPQVACSLLRKQAGAPSLLKVPRAEEVSVAGYLAC